MSNDTDPMAPSDPTFDESPTERLKHEIEETKEGLSETISALEGKFSPSQVREAVGAELQQVEERVRDVLADQLEHAKTLVQAEVVEAKNVLREGMRDAERMIRTGLGDAKESVKTELRHAVTGAKESLRAATLGRVETVATNVGDTMNAARDTLLDTLYNNPLPAAVTGVGLLWLLMNRSRSASDRSRGSNGSGGQAGATVGRVAQQAAGAVAQGMQGATVAAGDALNSASDLVTSMAQTATEGVHQAAQTVSDGALAFAGTAQDSAKRVERTVQRALKDRPLAVGAAALAIGTMVGCSLPRTKAEDELMGETRDNILTRAGDAVHDAATSAAKMSESETTEREDAGQSNKAGQHGRHENAAASRPSPTPTA
jgi:hypothetical protein